jgi:protein involved in polysaccharide export with SLBB domain
MQQEDVRSARRPSAAMVRLRYRHILRYRRAQILSCNYHNAVPRSFVRVGDTRFDKEAMDMEIPLRGAIASLLLAFTLMLSACASDGPAAGTAQNAPPPVYRLGTGDKLHITVFGEDNLSGDYTVTQTGDIVLPLAGNIHAAGLTVPQLQLAVITAFGKGYVHDPRVTIDASNLHPFFVLGEVNKPGQYAYISDLTVMDAVATAQGFTYRADASYVYIRHAREASEQGYPLTAAMAVQPGDTIRVTQRYF